MKNWTKGIVAAAVLAMGMTVGLVQAQSADEMTHGEVRRVDKGGSRITLRHEEIKNLEMPPMTMVFRVSDPAMLDQVKVGDKVKFTAQDLKGAITLMKLEPVR